MPSRALILPVEVECFLNASSKCRILPDGDDWDSAAGRDSSRSTSLPDSLLQRTVQEVICQSSLQPLLLSERKMYEMWRNIVCRRRGRLSYSMQCRPQVWGNVLFESNAVYFRIFPWFDFDRTPRRRRKRLCFFHCRGGFYKFLNQISPPWFACIVERLKEEPLHRCWFTVLQEYFAADMFLLCGGGNKRLY